MCKGKSTVSIKQAHDRKVNKPQFIRPRVSLSIFSTHCNWRASHSNVCMYSNDMGQRYQLDPFCKGPIIRHLEADQTQDWSTTKCHFQDLPMVLWHRCCSRRPVQGHPRVTTPEQDWYLALTARQNQMMPPRQVCWKHAVSEGNFATNCVLDFQDKCTLCQTSSSVCLT